MKENNKVNNVATPSESQQPATVPSTEKKRTPIQELMRSFKKARGIDPDNAKWDKINFSRYLRPARQLLAIFEDDHLKASEYMLKKASEWSNLDWGLDGIVRAASRDPKLYSDEVADSGDSISASEYLKARNNPDASPH